VSYSIIGFGKIGHALAKAFARRGIEVSVATTRDPQNFASAAAAIGPEIIPTTLAEAVNANIIFLARPYLVARESCSSRATLMLPRTRSARLRKLSVSRRSNWAAFRKVDSLYRRVEIVGAG